MARRVKKKTLLYLMKHYWFFGICWMLSVMWLSFVLYLDLQYDKFPAVLIGGIKILLAGYVVLGLFFFLWRGVAIACKRVRAMVEIR